MTLPLLIQTTLDFYKWLVRVQNLNEEYRNRVICQSSAYNNKETYMLWSLDGIDKFIRHLSLSAGIYGVNKYIKRFDKLGMGLIPRPKRYYYSSGLEFRRGYKSLIYSNNFVTSIFECH